SAGIGRTGTFIALDYLLDMAKAKGKVDILACVKRMREKRLNMVQTVAQYKFIYHTLLEALVCGDTSVPTQNLRAHVSALEGTNSSNHTGFTGEFQKLAKFCTLYNIHTCKEGVKPANKSKNRNQKILPADIFRPSLMTLTNKDGTPGYINAVFVDTYSKKEGFIVTQLPLKETITDFWSLVFDYKCNSLIVMNQVQELGENVYCIYSVEHCTSVGSNLEDKLTKKKRKINKILLLKKIAVTEKARLPMSEHQVNLFQLSNWSMQRPTPESPSFITNLLMEVERVFQENRILIACWDGASRCGLFCAASVVCEQIREEGLVDVFQAVKTIRRSRPQLLRDPEQYKFCYEIVKAYLDSFETYANF
uniref:Tyrosine-protein phosphatase non-receptor type 20 n=1 Tax=Latimeria chalumnae TaxID=7897 RepID=H3AWF9_LATCH